MAKIGIKCLTWAKYSSGGDGSAIVYTGGKQKNDYMVQADLTMDVSDGKEYADDHLIDSDASTTAVHLALELSNLDDDMLEDFCGMEAGESGEFQRSDASPGFLGCGFMMVNRFRGTVTYEGVWIHKIQFHQESVTASTKTENVEFSHENVTGDGVGVQLSSGGNIYFYAQKTGAATASAIETWLRGKAGIT